MMSDVWTDRQLLSLASLAETIAFDLRAAGIDAGATLAFARNLERATEVDRNLPTGDKP
jgi:hypothetical protein